MPRRSSLVEAHDIYKKYHRHFEDGDDLEAPGDEVGLAVDNAKHEPPTGPRDAAGLKPGRQPKPYFEMFHRVMRTGVIYATSRAQSHGFSLTTEDEWVK